MYARRTSVRLGAAILAVLLAAAGCGGGSSSGPTTEDFTRERQRVAAELQKKRDQKKKKKAAPAAAEPLEEHGLGLAAGAFTYDPTGKRDPFRSFEWERPDRIDESELRGPLEQYDVSQLALVAVVWQTGNARALIQDPTGASYIISEGTRIGKNEGRVIAIADNLLVVKERYVDFLGQETTKDIEMRIRRSEGG